MRIGIYDPYLDTMSGGEKYMLTAASCLVSEHNVSIFWNDEEFIRTEAIRKFGIDLQNISFHKNIFNQDTSLISRLSESQKYDYIIFLSDGSIPLIACSLILHFQTPVEWVINNPIKTKIKLLRTKKIICNSFYTKKYIDKKYGVNSDVLYPPITIGEEIQKVKKENIILNIGRFGIQMAGSSYKKQEILVDVFKEMVKKGLKNWSLVLLVSGAEDDLKKLDTLKDSAKGYPIEFVSNPNKDFFWKYCRKSKIYWHASGYGEDLFKHPDRAEHFGMSTVEAMSVGNVPIVINAGGQPEIVQDNKNGYVWNTIEELMQKTNKIIKDPKLWESFSEEAIDSAKRFSKERFCKELRDIFI